MRPEFHIIVAIDNQRGIAKNKQIPWHLPDDLKYFKKITTKTKDPKKRNAIIMGRKTWESLPSSFQPLPGRLNIILSSIQNKNAINSHPDIQVISNLETGLNTLNNNPEIESIFIIGGSLVYEQTLKMPNCKSAYITKIDHNYNCDTFFPETPKSFTCTSQIKRVYQNTFYYFETWTNSRK